MRCESHPVHFEFGRNLAIWFIGPSGSLTYPPYPLSGRMKRLSLVLVYWPSSNPRRAADALSRKRPHPLRHPTGRSVTQGPQPRAPRLGRGRSGGRERAPKVREIRDPEHPRGVENGTNPLLNS